MVTAILTKQGKKKKTMSGLKYPNKNEWKKAQYVKQLNFYFNIWFMNNLNTQSHSLYEFGKHYLASTI